MPSFHTKSILILILGILITVAAGVYVHYHYDDEWVFIAGGMGFSISAFLYMLVNGAEDKKQGRWLWDNCREHMTGASLNQRRVHIDPGTGEFHPETDRNKFVFRITYNIGGKVRVGELELPGTDPDVPGLLEMIPVDRTQYLRAKEKALSKEVVKTRIVDVKSKHTTYNNGTGRAVAGYIIAGPVGGLVGAMTGKSTEFEEKETTFKVWYADGHTDIETVRNGTEKWKKYLNLMEE